MEALIADYRISGPELLKLARQGCAQNQTSQIEINLHSLKSSSAVLGLEKVSVLAGVLEDRVKILVPSELELSELQDELDLAIKTICEFKRP